MLCSKCYKEIKTDKETQIKGSIICQICINNKPIGHCFTCESKKEIYYVDKFHEISISSSYGLSIWVISRNFEYSEKVIQCDECYQDWKKEYKKYKKRENIIEFLFLFSILGLLNSTLFIFYPDLFLKLIDSNNKILVIFFISFFLLLYVLNEFAKDDRFKFRKRKKNNKSKR